MKSYRQQKRKLTEITRKQGKCLGVSVKKSAKGTGRGHQNATESISKPHLEQNIQLQDSSRKIKLQLFPINEHTRLGLEKDGYNPFLELSLSPKKRISSVVRHLSTKWGSSSVAIGQLMLFPYNIKLEQLASSKRWTSNDSAISAWEVYVGVGSSSFFRLRYGWYSNLHQQIFNIPNKSRILGGPIDSEGRRECSRDFEIPNHQERKIGESCEAIKKNFSMNAALCSDGMLEMSDVPTRLVDDEMPTDAVQVHSTVLWDDNLTNLSIGGLLSEISLQGRINGSKDDEMPTDAVQVHSTVLWDDNLTNLSMGGLLSEILLQGRINGSNPSSINKSGTQPIGLISDMSIGDLLSDASLLGKMSNPTTKLANESSLQPLFLSASDTSIGGLLSEASLLSNKNKSETPTTESSLAQNQSPWGDTFTSLSIGGLLSEASMQAKLKDSKLSSDNAPLPKIFDSLDFAQSILHSQMPKSSCNEPNLSILDAEETCHAFPIKKLQPNGESTFSNGGASSGISTNGTISRQFQFPTVPQNEFSGTSSSTFTASH